MYISDATTPEPIFNVNLNVRMRKKIIIETKLWFPNFGQYEIHNLLKLLEWKSVFTMNQENQKIDSLSVYEWHQLPKVGALRVKFQCPKDINDSVKNIRSPINKVSTNPPSWLP